jgi:phosphatidylserine decarboxylase
MMSTTATNSTTVPQPLPDNFVSVQPGGGTCYSLELRWGRCRRGWLKRFRPGYVRRMAQLRHGDAAGAPHEILDPRDLKFCRNRCTCDWDLRDDPFRWRESIPFARWGLAELLLMGGPLLALTLLIGYFCWYLVPIPAVPLLLVVWFFRDPPRRTPQQPGLIISPADGKVVEITRLEHDEFIGGPAVRIGIFLSIFNVHLNRAPCAARVLGLRYAPGGFLNAMNPESAIQNENTWIGLEEQLAPHRRMIVRQISGAIARRIVCAARPGEALSAGQKFGMIKFGSRTELILADTPDLALEVAIGRRVRAGVTVMAKRRTEGEALGAVSSTLRPPTPAP